jgi:hypothetical protein
MPACDGHHGSAEVAKGEEFRKLLIKPDLIQCIWRMLLAISRCVCVSLSTPQHAAHVRPPCLGIKTEAEWGT